MNIHSVAPLLSNMGGQRRLSVQGVQGFKGFKGVHLVQEFNVPFLWHWHCCWPRMQPAKDFTELIAWQRADELERFAQELITRPTLARDRDYCAQTSDAAASAPRNIAEGFGRFAPAQFSNFVRIAIGSELEMKNQILKAWQRGALTDDEHCAATILCKRAIGAAVGLRRYLASQEAKANAKQIENQLSKKSRGKSNP